MKCATLADHLAPALSGDAAACPQPARHGGGTNCKTHPDISGRPADGHDILRLLAHIK
jgi:hypothetical protein